jgi:hypothetical protein
MLFARPALPDAPYWTGRRWLAAIDAVAWPAAGWILMSQMNVQGELVIPVVMALLVLSAAQRLFTALVVNHRYHFTTWRWGRVLAWMLVAGALLKLGLAV